MWCVSVYFYFQFGQRVQPTRSYLWKRGSFVRKDPKGDLHERLLS